MKTCLGLLLSTLLCATLHGLGDPAFVSFASAADGFEIATRSGALPWVADADAWPGVLKVGGLVADDVNRVVGSRPSFQTVPAKTCVLFGTLDRGAMMDALARSHPSLVERLRGKWEAYVIQVVDHPIEGVEKALVVVGSDKRGTEYGLFELSAQFGVSPWNWWADVPVMPQDRLVIAPGVHGDGEPAVKYRGIFLNDEAPALSGWAREKFGGINHAFYERLFELLLRLKANYLWPAMWNNAFNEDDPENPRLADMYGIVMGTSHHEPMLRAQQEWKRHGSGKWDYGSNAGTLANFWKEGVKRNRAYESIFTLGMRGDGDEPMTEGENVALLERIVADQRNLLRSEVNPDLTKVPQLWALYKEVQGYYERGMRVPDDVTLLWCDDNWGNIRRLPTPEERHRSGGAGVYYHFDYVGGPRSYKWLNTVPIEKVREQMNQALERGADRIWIVNVGDLKPLEFPTEFFLEFARHPERWPQEKLDDYTKTWAARDFGPEAAPEVAYLIKNYTRLNGYRKPELLDPSTFSLVNFREADRMEAAWDDLLARARELEVRLPAGRRDAYFQLVLFPVQASAQVLKLQLAAARNRLHATQGRVSANDNAAIAEKLFEADRLLTERYNETLAQGKWRHMADQTHLGYTFWQQPPVNVMPAVSRVQESLVPGIGVAVEGALAAWPGDNPFQEKPVAPEMHRKDGAGVWLEVFRKGGTPSEVKVSSEEPWLKASWAGGVLTEDKHIELSVNWEAAPAGRSLGHVRVHASSGEHVVISVPLSNDATPLSEGHLETHRRVVFDAVHATAAVPPVGGHWQVLKDFGPGIGAVTTLPVALPSVEPGKEAARLDYVWQGESAGPATLRLRFAPGWDNQPGKLRCAVSIDGGPPRVVEVAPRTPPEWEKTVSDGMREISLPVQIQGTGRHVLSYWMIDSGVVFERACLFFGTLRPSYFGPLESPHAAEDTFTFSKP